MSTSTVPDPFLPGCMIDGIGLIISPTGRKDSSCLEFSNTDRRAGKEGKEESRSPASKPLD